MIDFTLVVAVDQKHLDQLSFTWPTWAKYKPELTECPICMIYDADQVFPNDPKIEQIRQDNPHLTLAPWYAADCQCSTQREKMLTAMVVLPPSVVMTPWYVQIDTDAYAYDDQKWIQEEWFDGNKFFASPWGYSKPSNVIEIMDNWADNITGLKEYPRLDYPFDPKSSKVFHKRVASWIIFVNTEWNRETAEFAKVSNRSYYHLPFASQDTYFCYCANRRNEKFGRIPFRHFGWGNRSNTHGLKKICQEIMR